MLPQAIFVLLLHVAACLSRDSPQTVLSRPSADDAQRALPTFHPRDYDSHQHIAHCSAINRATPGAATLTELQLQYTYIPNPKASRTLLLVHGWPSLWSTWSKQILHFSANYSLLVPNLRGFGASTHPGDVQSSGNVPDIVADLACIMKDAAVQSAVCVGHDWGSQVCWEMARSRPDITEAVAGVVIPYLPSTGSFTPTRHWVTNLPRLAYMVYFDEHTQNATVELNASIRRSLRSVYRTVASPPPSGFLTSNTDFLKAYEEIPEIPAPSFFTNEEEDYLVEQFGNQGFDYTLHFYTTPNRLASFEIANAQGNHTIPQPALSVLTNLDPVADWRAVARLANSAAYIPHLTTEVIAAAHWPHLEFPDEFNKILETWLNGLSPAKPVVAGTAQEETAGSSRRDGEL